MILAVDIGNTNIVLGFFDGEKLLNECRLSTSANDSAEEYAIKLNSILGICNINKDDIEGSVLSSVVPPLNRTVSKALMLITGKKPIVVGPGVKTGLILKLIILLSLVPIWWLVQWQALPNIPVRRFCLIWVLLLPPRLLTATAVF